MAAPRFRGKPVRVNVYGLPKTISEKLIHPEGLSPRSGVDLTKAIHEMVQDHNNAVFVARTLREDMMPEKTIKKFIGVHFVPAHLLKTIEGATHVRAAVNEPTIEFYFAPGHAG